MYLSEHIYIGYAGKAFVLLALLAALLSAFSFFRSANSDNLVTRWRKAGRWLYVISFLSLLAAGGVLYFMIFNRYYEYQYVWKYSSNDMHLGYVISCFWAGQEGSFIIWAVFQALIGLIAMRFAGGHEGRVMSVVALSQFFLLSMIWGVEILGIRIGNTPFLLLRESAVNQGLEFFQNPEYLSMIRDGNGLNPLLENFWMIIHPPVLFIGYAAALIPYSYAISSLWQGDYRSWIKPALPWLLFAIISLGAGILMGGAWAYVDLTFGGFWAWDPVENASLVPWMLLVAAIHTSLIAYKRNHSYKAAYILSTLSFVFVIYASFLTRSGLLGDTSAHSFADDGLMYQMLAYLMVLLLIPTILLVKRWKTIAVKTTDDSMSREFWMFIGVVLIVLSAFQIIAATSLPVINKLIGTSFAPPLNRNEFYNNWQLPFAVLFALLAGFALLISYGKNNKKSLMAFILKTLLPSAILAIIIVWLRELYTIGLVVLTFAAVYLSVASLYYLIHNIRNKPNFGAAISHFGLGLFLAGVVFAFGQGRVISENRTAGFSGGSNMSAENQMLMLNDIQELGDYHVVYAGMEQKDRKLIYQLDFISKGDDDLFYLDFSMYPRIMLNARMGNVYTPATKSTWAKDLFIHITYADILSGNMNDDYIDLTTTEVSQGDSIRLPGFFLKLDSLIVDYSGNDTDFSSLSIMAPLKAYTSNKILMQDTMVFSVVDGIVERKDVKEEESGMMFVFSGISEKPGTIMIQILEPRIDFIVIKAREFPLIWLVWLGSIVMFIGVIVSFAKRLNRREAA